MIDMGEPSHSWGWTWVLQEKACWVNHRNQASKQHSSMFSAPISPCSRFLLESCTDFPQWFTMVRRCKPNNPFYTQVALLMVFITATECKLIQEGYKERRKFIFLLGSQMRGGSHRHLLIGLPWLQNLQYSFI